MSVETLQRLHGRYAELSSRFRAGWAFHQYAEGVRKIFPGPPRPDRTPEFQDVHAALKSIAARLNAEDPGVIEGELDSVGERLERLAAALGEEDSKLSPQVARQFFQRVKNEDENVLTQLVKFYVYSAGPDGWTEDRLDKVDFLLTRVAEERDAAGDRATLIDRRRLREIATGLWALLGSPEPGEELVERLQRQLKPLREAVAGAQTLDQLNEHRLVERYRQLKHGLGRYFFYPRILYELLETNLVLKNLIRQLYSIEERRITADYQRVFDLEREAVVDGELDRELRGFREEVEVFERRLQADELKLKDLAHLRGRIRALSGRLAGEAGEATPAVAPGAEEPEEAIGEEVVEEALAHLKGVLAELDSGLPPRRAVLGSELFALRLEPRELEAYRRLRQGGGGELDRVVLEAAALRVAVNRRVEEIRALLDDTATTGEAAVFARTRRTLRVAGGYVARLEAAVEQATLHGRVSEAQTLMVLRMRLVRDHAGTWLLAVRPLLARQESS